MRSLKILAAFTALAAALFALDTLTRPDGTGRSDPATTEILDLARLVEVQAGVHVTGIVLTRLDRHVRDFRGLHETDGRLRPVYGRLRSTCADATRSACWEIADLEIDGRPVTLHLAALPADASPASEADGKAEIETADIAPAPAGTVVALHGPVPEATATPTGPDDNMGGHDGTPVPSPRPVPSPWTAGRTGSTWLSAAKAPWTPDYSRPCHCWRSR